MSLSRLLAVSVLLLGAFVAAPPASRAEIPRVPLEIPKEGLASAGMPAGVSRGESGDMLVFRESELDKVLEVFSALGNLNLFLDDGAVNKKITFFAKDLSLREALEMMLRTNGLRMKPVGPKTYLIYPKSKDAEYVGEAVSRVFFLRHDDPKKVINILKGIGKTTRVFLNDRRNAIVMIDSPENVAMAEQIVSEMDRSLPQVIVDVKLVEVRRDRLTDLGIKLDKVPYTAKEMKAMPTLLSPALLDMLVSEGAAEILAAPKLRVVDLEKAEINVGDRIPIEISTSSQTPGGDRIQLNKTVQYESVGIKLGVEIRKIHSDREVSLLLSNEVSSLVEITPAGYPRISTRNAKTVVRLTSAETVVFGGLINSEERDKLSKVPLLGDLPGVGRLFRNPRNERVSTEILMFVTPQILPPDEVVPDAKRTVEIRPERLPDVRKPEPASPARKTEPVRRSNVDLPEPAEAAPIASALSAARPASQGLEERPASKAEPAPDAAFAAKAEPAPARRAAPRLSKMGMLLAKLRTGSEVPEDDAETVSP